MVRRTSALQWYGHLLQLLGKSIGLFSHLLQVLGTGTSSSCIEQDIDQKQEERK